MAFPQTPLDVRTELQLGGVWTDESADVYLRDKITITRGCQDQGSRDDPGACTLTFNNRLGKYSPRNPRSPLYGQIGRSTPLRVSVMAGSAYLDHPASPATTVRVSTPSTAALQITGDLDLRWDMQTSAWDSTAGVVELGGKWGAAGQRSWHAYLFAGTVRLGWTTDGTTEVTAAAPTSSTVHTPRIVLRIAVDVNNGAGGRTVQFFTGPGMSGPWTQIGVDNVIAGTTATASSTAAVEIGDNASTGSAHVAARIYAAQIRSGIGGTLVASPDFTAQTPGATSFSDSAGVPWTASSSAAITNRRIRFTGEVSSWPSRWDLSGKDVTASVQAAGIMRRLGQGASPLDSTLRRRIASYPSTVAYWGFEDGQGATQAYSPLPGVQAASVDGAQLASEDSLAGSMALPVWPAGSWFTCTVPVYAAATSWQVQHVYKYDTAPASYFTMLVIQSTGGTVRRWEIAHEVAGVRVRGLDAAGTLIVDQEIGVGSDIVGPWTRQTFTVTQSGTSVLWHIGWTVVGVSGGSFDGSFTGTSGQVSDVHNTFFVAFDNLSLGHIAVFNDAAATAFNQADTGFDGDSAMGRVLRLCGEEGVPFLAPYGQAGTEAMGPQKPDTLLNLCGDAADADAGILCEAREAVALALRPRVSLYNQVPALALDYAADGHVAGSLEPTEDDTATRNDITRSRPSGSSARLALDTGPLSTQAPPAGVGRYADSQTINVHSDAQLLHAAGWALRLGTVDEARYPAVSVNLAAAPALIDQATAVDVGDRATIDNPPAWLAPGQIDLQAQGYTETLGLYDWDLTYNCAPGSPWVVGVLDDPALSGLDTLGSRLASAAGSTDTTLSLETTAGPLWITTATRPGDFPFDVMVGGERIRITAITGTSSPQSATAVRSVNGITKAQAAGTAVALAQPFILAR